MERTGSSWEGGPTSGGGGRRGELSTGPLARGLYAQGPEPESAEQRHRELCRGMLLLYPDVSTDAALGRGLVTTDAFGIELERRAGPPRCQHARAMVSLADGRSESPGETRLRVLLTSFGFRVTSQVIVRDGDTVVARADLGIDGTSVLLEFDGAVKYRDGGPESLVREKRREDRLRALGWIVLRFTWADLEHPGNPEIRPQGEEGGRARGVGRRA